MASKDFRFDYEKHQSKSVNVEVIDLMIDSILKATGTFALIVLSIKAMALGALFIIRGRIIDDQERIDRQNYELKRGQSNAADLEADDLD